MPRMDVKDGSKDGVKDGAQDGAKDGAKGEVVKDGESPDHTLRDITETGLAGSCWQTHVGKAGETGKRESG